MEDGRGCDSGNFARLSLARQNLKIPYEYKRCLGKGYRFNIGLKADSDPSHADGFPTSALERRRKRTCYDKFRSGKWILVSRGMQGARRDSKVLLASEIWDFWILLVLVFTCFETPYSVAFPSALEGGINSAQGINDLLLTIDVLLNFFLAIPASETDDFATSSVIKDPLYIAASYMSLPLRGTKRTFGWFWIDLAALLPCWIRICSYPLGMPLSTNSAYNILRLSRLLRIMRLHRIVAILHRVQVVIGFSYRLVQIATFVSISIVACHWFACLWALVALGIDASNHDSNPENPTWLTAVIASKNDPCYPFAPDDPRCAYALSLYWSAMTLTTVGYGDVVPKNTFEFGVCICLMVMAGYAWAFVVGSVVSVLSEFDPHGFVFKQRMDDLNSLMRQRRLPTELRVRLRIYMHTCRHLDRRRREGELLQQHLSRGLQREVAVLECSMLTSVWWTIGLKEQTKLEIVKSLVFVVFGPREEVGTRETMIILRRGMLAVQGIILLAGDAWGHDTILLQTPSLMAVTFPHSLSYVEVASLTKATLLSILDQSPQCISLVRKAQVRTAVFRAFIIASKSADTPLEQAFNWGVDHTQSSSRQIIHGEMVDYSTMLSECQDRLEQTERQWNRKLNDFARMQSDVMQRLDKIVGVQL
eukprot:TRINITY_DN28086_c0_g1_i1.p1 TRINITY_DN28086_c0_g1~~TRINITY_DN28086_c0_g1_i1.p1  ORF type:complete len:647 (+),score=63.06 TRINITY_DN28086_c0_g1_i1:88-2028(+)